MRRALFLVAVTLMAAGCGGDDDDETTAPETGATGTAAAGASYDITVGEFIVELQPDKQRILKAFVADSDACEGVKVDPGFVLLVSAQAIDADQDAPLADLVEGQC
jgi:ABC-type glycerol-3-phosphate transport system substrate-binding protein